MQSKDAEFKQLLSSVVDTDSWAAARDIALQHKAQIDRALTTTRALQEQAELDVAAAAQRLQQLEQQQQQWEDQQQRKRVSLLCHFQLPGDVI
jgi:hypothetical protein